MQNKTNLLMALASVLGISMAVVIWAPASWLAHGVRHLSNGYVQMLEPRGSVWSGSAHLAFSAGTLNAELKVLPDRLSWRLTPDFSQMGWGVALQFEQPCCLHNQPRFRLLRNTQSWIVLLGSSLKIMETLGQKPNTESTLLPILSIPVSLISSLVLPLGASELDGDLGLSVRDLRFVLNQGNWRMQGQVQVSAKKIRTRLVNLDTLGSYVIGLEGGDSVDVRIQSQSGG